MPDTITHSIQDYLKTIHALTETGEPASTTDMAARLGLAPASVTGMLQRLAAADPPLVIYHKHQGVILTQAGERIALEVIRHHRLIETYLVRTLGYTWDQVHEEACRLEHAISEAFEARIAEALGHPERDPHGEPIPNPDLVLPPPRGEIPLTSLRPGQAAVIRRVRGDDAAFLRHLQGLGLFPGTSIKAVGFSAYDRNLTLKLSGAGTAVIGPAVAEKIFIEVTS